MQEGEELRHRLILPQLSDDAWSMLFGINSHPSDRSTGYPAVLRRSNMWSPGRDLNPRPPPYQGCKAANLDAEKFKEWLFKEYRPKTAKNRLSYALRFKHCLLTRDFSELKLLSDDTRIHTMKALSALAKFLGIYDDFKALVRNYGLRWSNNNKDQLIIARLTKTVNSNEIVESIREVKKAIPEYSHFMDLITVTGLRFMEAVNSWNLIVQLANENRLSEYYKSESETLEHFRFKRKKIAKFEAYHGRSQSQLTG